MSARQAWTDQGAAPQAPRRHRTAPRAVWTMQASARSHMALHEPANAPSVSHPLQRRALMPRAVSWSATSARSTLIDGSPGAAVGAEVGVRRQPR